MSRGPLARSLTTLTGLVLMSSSVMAVAPTAGAGAPRTPRPMYAGTKDFTFTGAPEDWTVPAGVHSIVATVCGASGENMLLGGSQVHFAGRPGHGGCVTATVAVTPAAVLHVRVGGTGSASAGGWPDGGERVCTDICGGSGGGSSDIRMGGDALADRVLVGGGGGGGGGGQLGGSGGNAGNGTDGFNGSDGGTGAGLPDDPNHPRGGIGGTLVQETKGCGVSDRVAHPTPQCVTGQQPNWAYPPGHAGSANLGSDSPVVFSGASGGAGGGGYFGGGGGCAWNSNYDNANANLGTCGGGGGSSWADPATTTDHSLSQGTANWYDVWLAGGDTPGDPGTVSISWPGPDLPVTTDSAPTTDGSGSGGIIPATGSHPSGVPMAIGTLVLGAGLVIFARRRTV